MYTENLKTPQMVSKDYTEIIARNLKKLTTTTEYNQNKLAAELQNQGLAINQGTISKYISGKLEIQFSVIVKLCEIFKISISDLVNKDFEYNNPSIITNDSELEKVNTNISTLVIPNIGDKFFTNPQHEYFEAYLQKYYCYFFPTLSREKKILTGELELSAEASYCKSTLSLNTNKTKHGKPIYKYYTGCAIISKAVESCYIILSSAKEGELCLLNLRHFFIRHENLNCRMAEVITNSAGERHFPTVHRMLLSRSPIKEEHLLHILPHLHLNSNDIHIKKEELEKLKLESQTYNDLIEHLLHKVNPDEIYNLKEDYITSNAKQFLSKDETRLFLSTIRDNSYKTRYNKVSNKLDETIHELLLSLGYYNDKNEVNPFC